MKVELLSSTFELENNKESVDKLFERIESILEGGQYAFDFMEVDGNQIYENYYDYFIDNLADIKEVKASIISVDEIIRNILVSTAQYVEGAVPEIGTLSDEFYRRPEQATWGKLQQLIEGIEWINSSAEVIAISKKNSKKVFEYVKAASEMKSKLLEFEEAIKNSDMVLIGDLLSYEVIPMLESIKNTANDIINSEVGKDVSD